MLTSGERWGKVNNSPNFIGVYHYSLDAKNRLAIPVKFRSSLEVQKESVLTQGLEKCLTLYSSSAWQKVKEKLDQYTLKNRVDMRAFKRMLFSSASEVSFDEEGRILVPQHLVGYAQLKKEVVLIGLGEKIEIWSKHLWEQYEKKQKVTFERHASELEL